MQIHNDGQRILRTDYWQSDHARRGYAYLSVNAGAVRLLIPRSLQEATEAIRDARAARVQIAGACRGDYRPIHVVLDDDSAAPYCLTLDVRQCDRTLPVSEVGRAVPLFAYAPAHGVSASACRLVASIRAVIAPASADPDLSPVVVPS